VIGISLEYSEIGRSRPAFMAAGKGSYEGLSHARNEERNAGPLQTAMAPLSILASCNAALSALTKSDRFFGSLWVAQRLPFIFQATLTFGSDFYG
jgi:hypothetical protein